MYKAIRTVTAALALTTGAAVGAPALPAMGDVANDALTVAQERDVGRQMMAEVYRRLPLLEDPEATAYIQDLGRRLATHSDAPQLDYRFFIVDSPSINAFAMPGGYIGVNSGLIISARSESELAGVLAHEIAHVTQRHLARRVEAAQRMTVPNMALLLASILLSTQDAQAGGAAMAAATAGSIQQQLNYSRGFEHEADHLGIRMLAAAQFDPQGMPAFFDRLAQATRYQNRPPEYLSTHPVTESRVAEASNRAANLSGGRVFESDTFHYIQSRLRTLQQGGETVAAFRTEAADASKQDGHAARYGLALALTRERKYDEARAILEQLLKENGDHHSLLLAQARLERDAGNLSRSRSLYEQVLSLYPSSYPARIGYAEALLRDDLPDKAYWTLNRALPSSEPAVYWLLAKAASAAGIGAEPQLAMAEYYELRGDLDAALNQLQQVLNNPAASPHETARASARREQLQREMERLARE